MTNIERLGAKVVDASDHGSTVTLDAEELAVLLTIATGVSETPSVLDSVSTATRIAVLWCGFESSR